MDKMMWTEPANPPTKPTPKPVVVSRLFVVLMISTVGTAAAVWVEQEAPQFGTFGAVKDVPGRYTLFPTPNYNRAEIAAYLEAGGLALEQPAGMTPPTSSSESRQWSRQSGCAVRPLLPSSTTMSALIGVELTRARKSLDGSSRRSWPVATWERMTAVCSRNALASRARPGHHTAGQRVLLRLRVGRNVQFDHVVPKRVAGRMI
jgi:hypothetical protein